MESLSMKKVTKVIRGDWLLLPSGRTIEVCKVIGESHPEVSIRYLDDDGVRAIHDFVVRLSWLLMYGGKLS